MELGARQDTIKMLISYLEGRTARINIGAITIEKGLTRACPQGSQYGLVLWNVAMEITLRVHTERFEKVVVYADDILVLVAGSRKEKVKESTSLILDRLLIWQRIEAGILAIKNGHDGIERRT